MVYIPTPKVLDKANELRGNAGPREQICTDALALLVVLFGTQTDLWPDGITQFAAFLDHESKRGKR